MAEAGALGILGGTFNPPHLGHLIIAQEAYYRCRLDRVNFIPALRNPLKERADDDQPADTRLSMLKLALGEDSRFCIDQGELRAAARPENPDGRSYTIDTLKRFNALNPQTNIYLILGADSALTLPQWKSIEQYPGLCRILIASRPGYPQLEGPALEALLELGLLVEQMQAPLVDISSAEIRRRVRQGKPIRYLVPDGVAQFVHKYGLYK